MVANKSWFDITRSKQQLKFQFFSSNVGLTTVCISQTGHDCEFCPATALLCFALCFFSAAVVAEGLTKCIPGSAVVSELIFKPVATVVVQ